jgi:hypothetical protein
MAPSNFGIRANAQSAARLPKTILTTFISMQSTVRRNATEAGNSLPSQQHHYFLIAADENNASVLDCFERDLISLVA